MPNKKTEFIVTTVDNQDLNEASIDLNETSRNTKEDAKYKNHNQVNKLIVQILKELKKEKDKLLVNINEKQQDIQELLSKIESQNKIIKSLEDTNINLKNQIDDFNDSIKENEVILQNNKQEFENMIELKDEEIKSINQENLDLKNQINDFNDSIKENEVILQNNKQEFENIIELKDKEITSINKENLDLKNQMESLNNYINKYKEKLSWMKNEKDLSDKAKLQNIEMYKDKITKLEEERDTLINNNKKREEQLLQEINTIQSTIDKYADTMHEFKIEKILAEKDYFNKVNIYEEIVGELREDSDEFFLDSNLKIASLLKIIEEKDKNIEKLHEMLNE